MIKNPDVWRARWDYDSKEFTVHFHEVDMILDRLVKSNSSSVLSLLLVFVAFGLGSIFLHQVVVWTGLTGLPSFLLYTIPFWVLISWAMADSNETLLRSLIRNGLWGYAFILGVAGVALLIH